MDERNPAQRPELLLLLGQSRPCLPPIEFLFRSSSFTSPISQRNTAVFHQKQQKRRKKEGAVLGAPPAGFISRRPSAALA